MTDATTAALITAATSLAVTLIGTATTGYLAYRNNKSSQRNARELENVKQEHAQQLAQLQAELQSKQSQNDARTEYEFEARKRLYTQFEPLLYQLLDASSQATGRIQNIAFMARLGNLKKSGDGWLNNGALSGYYATSTVYRLIRPASIFLIMQRALTNVDLRLEPRIDAHMFVMRQIYRTFSRDYELARLVKPLQYQPEHREWLAKRTFEPQVYWRQGIFRGILELFSETLIESDASGALRCMTYGEFDAFNHEEINEQNRRRRSIVAGVFDIFADFHPATRPVLWRILVCQFVLYHMLSQIDSLGNMGSVPEYLKEMQIPHDLRDNLDWTVDGFEGRKGLDVAETFEVAIQYAKRRIPALR